ncbi:hypothetical protein F5Y16DRAFT_419748 [Xylariaceae sp. FL0255]|nr:hypothetical protein F5Y16DRAFT_419748 [Xylariaceae sp. FL0255]
MHFSTASALLALPLLATADTPDYQAQFQNYFGQASGYFEKFTSKIPSPNKFDPVAAAEAKIGASKIHVLSLNNWKDTLYEPVTPGSTEPEGWWLLISGRNKTCFGHCDKVEAAFNETAGKFAVDPTAPHMALLNCDDQPVLCNAWSAPVGAVWIIEMLPKPAPINIYSKRFNLTTTTSEDFVQLRKDGYKTQAKLHESYFHPFDGVLEQYGVSVPFGYLLWALSIIPSWAFMILVSMVSRSMMSNRINEQARGPGPRPAPTGQAAPR